MIEKGDTVLSEKEFDVLWQLSDTEFKKPMDFGAWDASHHSGTARRLAAKGLVEIDGYRSWQRRVNKYRRTPEGRAAYEAERERRRTDRLRAESQGGQS